MTNERLTVLVTGVGGGGVGEGIVKALRLARRYRIVVTEVDALSATLFRADAGYVVPRASEPQYIDALIRICKTEGVQVLIPGSEAELERISTDRDRLFDTGLTVLIATQTAIVAGQDKWRTYELLRDRGFTVPQTMLLEDEAVPQFSFPWIVKPRTGGGGSKRVFAIHSAVEYDCVRTLFRTWRQPGVVQAMIGSIDAEYTVGVLVSRTGRRLSSVCLRRTLLAGASGRMVTADVPELHSMAFRIAQELGVIGPLNVQCRIREDGVAVPFELNVRFSGTTPIRAGLQANEVDMAIRDIHLRETVEEVAPTSHMSIARMFQEVYIDSRAVDLARESGVVKGNGSVLDYV